MAMYAVIGLLTIGLLNLSYALRTPGTIFVAYSTQKSDLHENALT